MTILRILFFFSFICCLVFAADIVSIRDFKGMVSNADLEDIPDENAALMINLAPYNGKLKMTAGHGRFAAADSSHQIKGKVRGLVTYLDSHMGWDEVADSGRAYLAYTLKAGDTAVIWLHDSLKWDTLDVTGGYLKTAVPKSVHKDACNPIIQIDNTVRFLPGNVGAGEGIWIGYLNNKYFDNGHQPAAGYYAYKTTISKPNIGVTIDTISVRTYPADSPNRYYKFSYVYDGVQEGLLSNSVFFADKDSVMTELTYTIETLNFNKRITAINIYKSTDDLTYGLLATIDLLRTDLPNKTNPFAVKRGAYHAYVPSMGTQPICDTNFSVTVPAGDTVLIIPGDWDHIFKKNKWSNCGSDSGFIIPLMCTKDAFTRNDSTFVYISKKTAYIWPTDYGTINIIYRDTSGTGGGYCFLYSGADTLQWNFDSLTFNNHVAYDSIFYGVGVTRNKFKQSYGYVHTPYYPAPYTPYYWTQKTGTDFSWGNHYVLIDTAYAENSLSGSILLHHNVLVDTNDRNYSKRLIEKNYGIAVKFYGDTLGITNDLGEAIILKTSYGMYTLGEGAVADTCFIHFYDPGITAGDEFPLAGEVSIQTNGKYAAIVEQRLWQGNIVLIDGTKYEYHTDWVSYSEDGQYDVNPVSNVIRMAGEVVGIENLYGNVVVLCKNQIQTIDVKTSTTPANWRITESVHNIGSCAPKGHGVFRGNLFVTTREGIYMLRPNNLAEADRTPTLNLLITDPIQDVFDSNAYPESTVISYNADLEEVMFKLYGATQPTLCYNITNGQWRELRSKQLTPLIASVDENNDPIWYCSDSVIYNLNTAKKDTVTTWKSKVYRLDREVPVLTKYAYLTYVAYACSLRMRTYEDNSATPADTFYFPAATVPTTTKKFLDNSRAKKIQFECMRWPDKSDTAYIEIHNLEVEK